MVCSTNNSVVENQADSVRLNALTLWVHGLFADNLQQGGNAKQITLSPLSGDAGFRNYFRFSTQGKNYLAVDAAPATSNNSGFVAIAHALAANHLLVPEIISFDAPQGFMIISDLGKQHFADALNEIFIASESVESDRSAISSEYLPEQANQLYRQAIEQLVVMQTTPVTMHCASREFASNELNGDNLTDYHLDYQLPDYQLPEYDDAFVELELAIFSEWLLGAHLSIELSSAEQAQLKRCFSILIENVAAQPKCFMHRDYHSRNLLLHGDQAQSEIAVIDFQDAVVGPITYDIVSLLRDCYQRLPQADIEQLFNYFTQLLSEQFPDKRYDQIDGAIWQRWFDLMGLQRHIKASGIFARLYHRDNKSGYLADIPLTLDYIVEVASNYPELAFLAELVTTRVKPALAKGNRK